jgi:hypothetical protein
MKERGWEEKEYLSQLRKQQATSNAAAPSESRSSPRKHGKKPVYKYKEESEESSTSSVDTHLDECEICDDGGGK